MTSPLHAIAYFFSGAFLSNTIPHLVLGVQGRPFQTPFAKPPGVGLSTSVVNVLWGLFNLAVGYLLMSQVGEFNFRSLEDVGVAFLGFAVTSIFTAKNFGKLHGGNTPGTLREK